MQEPVKDRAISLRLVLAHCLCWAAWAYSSVAAAPPQPMARPLEASLSAPRGDVGAVEPSGALLCEQSEPGNSELASERKCERRDVAPALPPDPGSVAAADTAPMCDVTGASVEGRVEIPEIDQGRLDVLPCEVVVALFGWKLADLQLEEAALSSAERQPVPPSTAPHERSIAVLAVSPSALLRDEPGCLSELRQVGLDDSRGHRARLYRPPLELS